MVASVVLAGEFLFPNTYLLHMSRSILHEVVREIIIVGIALGLRRVDHGPHTAMIFSLRGDELGENRKLSKSVGRWRPAPRGRRSRPAAPKAAELKGNGKEVVQHDLVLLDQQRCARGVERRTIQPRICPAVVVDWEIGIATREVARKPFCRARADVFSQGLKDETHVWRQCESTSFKQLLKPSCGSVAVSKPSDMALETDVTCSS